MSNPDFHVYDWGGEGECTVVSFFPFVSVCNGGGFVWVIFLIEFVFFGDAMLGFLVDWISLP